MWRDTIIEEEDNRIVATGDNVRMNTGEIADLFNITAVSMNRAVKRVLKSDVLNDYKVVKFVRLDNGLLLGFYSLEHIIVLSYKWNTFLHLCYWDKGKLATHSSNSFATIGTQPYHSVKPKRLCIAIAHNLATSYRCAPPIAHAQHCHLSLRTCPLGCLPHLPRSELQKEMRSRYLTKTTQAPILPELTNGWLIRISLFLFDIQKIWVK